MAATAARNPLSGLPRRLVQDGIVAEELLERALGAVRERRAALVPYLVGENLASAGAVAVAAAYEFGVPLLDLDAAESDMDAVRLVSEKLLQRHRVLPLRRRGRRIYVALADPTDLAALDEIKFQTGLSVEAVVVEQDKLDKHLTALLETLSAGVSALGDDALDLQGVELSTEEEDSDQDITRADLEDAPIVRFVNKVLLEAMQKGASDIHFEPYEQSLRVRLRLDGVLKEMTKAPIHLAIKIAARIKVMARLDIAERRVPQDGRIKMRLSKSRAIDFRVNTCPTLFGEKVVLRLLDASQARLGIDSLGYDEVQKKRYLDTLAKPYGMIIVTGPTGSGKTVSLYTGLQILNTVERNISTAEDPVEINIQGINQVSIRPRVGLTFAAALRAFLRQDPDVIMVGEIRDLETAEIAIKAAQTGHLVLSTLHTNDAQSSLTRLVDMGAKPYAIASSVTLIIAQRLARRLCSHCKQPAEIPAEALLEEGFEEAELADLMIYEPVGCSRCTDGYKGRTGIFQVMPVTHEIGRLVMAGSNATQIGEQSRLEGVADLRSAGLQKVREGQTSLQEINRVTVD